MEDFFKESIGWFLSGNGEMTISRFNGEWSHSQVLESDLEEHFSLIVLKDELKLLSNNGYLFDVDLTGLSASGLSVKEFDLDLYLIVEDRDNNELLYLKQEHLNERLKIEQIIAKHAKPFK